MTEGRADSRNPVALCLAGGGYAGALFEFGAVHALTAGLAPWRPDGVPAIVGTSGGAVVGAVLAMGVDPREVRAALGDRNHPLRFRRGDFSRIPWSRHLAGGLRLLRALPRLVRGQMGAGRGDLLEDIRPLLPLGAFASNGLGDFLERAGSLAGGAHRFSDLQVPLMVTATDLDGGDRVIYGTGWDETPPVTLAVRASSAIPVYFEPVRIGGRDLIDGQIVDPLHLDLAAVKGARAVIAISPLLPYRPADSGLPVSALGAAAVMDQSGRIAAAVKLRASLERYEREHEETPCFLVQPAPDEVGELLRTGFGSRSLTRAWELGFRAAVRMLGSPGPGPAGGSIGGIPVNVEAAVSEAGRLGVVL